MLIDNWLISILVYCIVLHINLGRLKLISCFKSKIDAKKMRTRAKNCTNLIKLHKIFIWKLMEKWPVQKNWLARLFTEICGEMYAQADVKHEINFKWSPQTIDILIIRHYLHFATLDLHTIYHIFWCFITRHLWLFISYMGHLRIWAFKKSVAWDTQFTEGECPGSRRVTSPYLRVEALGAKG